jgi:cytochrome c-type biogenesis protein CcmE
MTGRPRLVVALVVASLLSVFLVYNLVISNGGRLVVSVGQLLANVHGSATQTVTLAGHVVSCEPSCGPQAPFTMVVRDNQTGQTVTASYRSGAVPDAFRRGRDVIVTGKLHRGMFVGNADTLLTKCPSKYASKPSKRSAAS